VLSLLFGFFTVAILFANEVPDYLKDKLSGKHNLVSIILPQRAYQAYCVLVVAGFISIALGNYLGYRGFICLFTFVLVFSLIRAAKILR